MTADHGAPRPGPVLLAASVVGRRGTGGLDAYRRRTIGRPPMRSAFARVLARLEALASGRRGALVLFGIALALYAVRAIAWPLRSGRDLDEYLLAYVQLFDHDVLLPWSMLFRTPITPLYAGASLDLFGGRLAEPAMAMLYAGSIVCWSAAARHFGPRVAIAVAAMLLAYQGYALMFHELSSEPLFAAAFAGWALLVVRAAFVPTTGRFALVGLGVAVLALVRPGNAVLIAFALVPLLVAGVWRARLVRTAAFLLAAVLPLLAWSVHNGVRFDSWGLARGGNAIIPFYRAFITDHIVSAENGEDSRRLAVAMQRHLLTREPYRSYGVTLDQLFRDGSFRVHEDLYLLSDQVFGWDSDYEVLRGAGVEGVRAHPGTYARGVARTVWDELAKAQFRVVDSGSDEGKGSVSKPNSVVIGGKTLPAPSEGEPIPAGQVVWISRPDRSIRQVWTSATKWHLEFEHPADRTRFDDIRREVNVLFASLPDRNGNAQLALRLNQLSRWFPRPWMWIVLGLIAILVRRPRGWPILVALALAAFAVVLLNALGLFADLHFVLPVSPAFVLLGLGGLLGAGRVGGTGVRVRDPLAPSS
jgi:hypothetical protein